MSEMTLLRTRADAFGWHRVTGNKLSIAGIVILAILVVFAAAGRAISPFDPNQIAAGPTLNSPTLQHLMGTDELGRDLFSRVLSGIRVSMIVGLSASGVATVVGVTVGALAGFRGGLVDDLLMRFTEFVMVVPTFFVALVIVAIFGASTFNVVSAIAVLSWPIQARLVRSEFLSLRTRLFVDAARVAGAGMLELVFGEILPNALGPVIVLATLQVGQAILLEAALSYLGLGDPNNVSLGLLLQEGQSVMVTAPWTSAFPGLFIFLAVLSSNLAGDALNEFMNPRSRA
jgi:peptide/nickel transport system permease protein